MAKAVPTVSESRVRKESPERKADTWTEHAYLDLREDILSGALQPDARLKIEELKDRYKVGPTPLREALSRLSSEGLVHAEQLKGYRVASMSLRELEELCDLRSMIETEALRRSIENGDDEWEDAIVASFHKLDRLEQKLANGEQINHDIWEDRNREFHDALISAADSAWLLRIRKQLWDHHERYRRFAKALLVQYPSSTVNDEHRTMMESALERDYKRAAEAMRAHIMFTIDLLRDHFQDQ